MQFYDDVGRLSCGLNEGDLGSVFILYSDDKVVNMMTFLFNVWI